MNFQEIYNTSVLFGTQIFPNTKYNVFKSYLYGIQLCFFNASSDHHCFFFSKCEIIKYSVACYIIVIALFS